MIRVLLAGPQGSGKTTQAKLLADRLNLCLIKMGDILRQKAAEDSELGQNVRNLIDQGILVPSEWSSPLVKEYVESLSCPQGMVVDGYPRTLDQLGLYDPKYTHVVLLQVSDQLGVQRLLERGRSDDTPEVINERLREYHAETEPVLEYYRKQGIVIEVDASQSIEAVDEAIVAALQEKTDGSNS